MVLIDLFMLHVLSSEGHQLLLKRQQGLRKRLAHLREYLLKKTKVDFGFLGCHEKVVGFYAASGFQQVHQRVYNLNPDSQTWETYHGPTMVMPIHKPMHEWNSKGTIHLNGMPW